jgi:H+/Cl- antiporter ClcA
VRKKCLGLFLNKERAFTMEFYKKKTKSAVHYVLTFLRWVFIAGVVGLSGGVVGSLFHKSVEAATEIRTGHDWMIWLLPVGGICIAALYRLFQMCGIGTNQLIDSIRTDRDVPIAMAPLIFVSTVITHLFGGSAGREGAALQLGGSISYFIGNLMKLDEKDMHLITLCGMSSVFSALFGTPLTATLFAMEVITVGIIYYSGFVPCIFSSLIAYRVSLLFHVVPVHFKLKYVPAASTPVIIKTVVLSALCAVVSILFCILMHETHHYVEKILKNLYVRIATGGLIIIVLTFLVQTRDYNGAGMDVIARAIAGNARPEAFVFKMIFTAVTISTGFKGGEIVPTFFIGATFGCVMANLLGMDPGFGAAIGLVTLFCGVVNSPISSILLSIEIFGADGLLLFAIACSVTNMLSGNYGLYSSQKIMYSKLKAEYINTYAK